MTKKYNREWLLNQHAQGKEYKYIFFWGHTPNNSEIDKSCLSQWYPITFEAEGIRFKTSEHWMMYQKAILFEDTEVAKKIIEANTPDEAKKLGRQVQGFHEEHWSEHKYKIVMEGNQLKFTQNEECKKFLLSTGERVLVEASPIDPVWGVGLAQDHPDVIKPENWRGENLLGFALMEVRDILK